MKQKVEHGELLCSCDEFTATIVFQNVISSIIFDGKRAIKLPNFISNV